MTEVYLKKIRQDECPSCGKALRQPQTEQGLSVGEIGLVYASAIEAVEEQQTDALKIAREAAIEECAALAEKLWLDGEPYSEVFDHIRALAALEQSK
jgi:hypothetical protein